VAHKELTVPSIEQFYLEVSEASKIEVLSRILDTYGIKLSLVFCNTKKRVDELVSSLQLRGFSAEALHGDMRQEQRDKVMSQFRKGAFDILIATDVAARGIDVDDVEAVFNYDIPNDDEYYVHRIGRTGRAGRAGKAFTFVVGRDIYKIRDIQRFTKSQIKYIKPPTISDVEETKMSNILDTLKENLGGGELSKYSTYIEKVLEEVNSQSGEGSFVTTLDMAAALLKMYSGLNGNKIEPVPEIDEERHESDGETVRLFINIGSNDKIQPKHIVESIASVTKLPGKLIGAIDIFDRFTFVEVPKEYSHEVMESMKNYRLKGKRINVEKSNKKKGSKRERSGRFQQ
jgi:ATP-dependent RNA helicase DeaD